MNKIVTLIGSSIVQPDRLPIAVRAYATRPLPPDDEGPKKKRPVEPAPASEWTLIFDTETTVDAAQRLRIGAYQFRNRDELDEGGLFYDPAIHQRGRIEFASPRRSRARTYTALSA